MYKPNSSPINSDKGQGVKKYNPDKSINQEWVKIHKGTKPPKNSFNCHGIEPDYSDLNDDPYYEFSMID